MKNLLFVVGLVLLTVAGKVHAKGGDPLAEAEAAAARVDFDETRKLAQGALDRGNYERRQVVRIYFLLGVANAALGQEEASAEAFKRLLEVDPQTKLDADLSPKLRGPMHEARGFWGSRSDRLGVETKLSRDGTLYLTLTDTLGMARELVVRARVGSGGAFVETRVPAAPSGVAKIAGAAGAAHVEYSVALVDDHGNRLLERGSDAQPEVVDLGVSERPAATVTEPIAPARGPMRPGVLIAGIVGEVLGVVGLGGGIAAWFIGSAAADRWNDDSRCLVNGMTREANCSSDRKTAQNGQIGAIVGFSAGGVLVLASTVLLLAAPRAERAPTASARASLHCGPGPGAIGFACGGTF
jgi:hypothetical protein